MTDLPEVLQKAAREVQSMIDQIQNFQVKYASLETQLRIVQNDLWAAETELAQLRKAQASEAIPPYIGRKL